MMIPSPTTIINTLRRRKNDILIGGIALAIMSGIILIVIVGKMIQP